LGQAGKYAKGLESRPDRKKRRKKRKRQGTGKKKKKNQVNHCDVKMKRVEPRLILVGGDMMLVSSGEYRGGREVANIPPIAINGEKGDFAIS